MVIEKECEIGFPAGFSANCISATMCACMCGTKTSCDDNNLCTIDSCISDTCSNILNWNAKRCQDNGGTCNPKTGECEYPSWPQCDPTDTSTPTTADDKTSGSNNAFESTSTPVKMCTNGTF